MDPGPWTFGQLVTIAEGRKAAATVQAVEIWRIGLGGGQTDQSSKIQITDEQAAAAIWSQLGKSG